MDKKIKKLHKRNEFLQDSLIQKDADLSDLRKQGDEMQARISQLEHELEEKSARFKELSAEGEKLKHQVHVEMKQLKKQLADANDRTERAVMVLSKPKKRTRDEHTELEPKRTKRQMEVSVIPAGAEYYIEDDDEKTYYECSGWALSIPIDGRSEPIPISSTRLTYVEGSLDEFSVSIQTFIGDEITYSLDGWNTTYTGIVSANAVCTIFATCGETHDMKFCICCA